jgi:hypothetical protein
MQRHWAVGLDDFENTLADASCLDMPPKGENFVTYDVHRKERFTAEAPDPTALANAFSSYAFHSTQGQPHKPGEKHAAPAKKAPTKARSAVKKPAASKPTAKKPAAKKVAAKR